MEHFYLFIYFKMKTALRLRCVRMRFKFKYKIILGVYLITLVYCTNITNRSFQDFGIAEMNSSKKTLQCSDEMFQKYHRFSVDLGREMSPDVITTYTQPL